MSIPTLSDNLDVNQALTQAVSLELITVEHAQALCQKHSAEEIQLILEQIASEQMGSGRQCIGDQCLL